MALRFYTMELFAALGATIGVSGAVRIGGGVTSYGGQVGLRVVM